ncbi:MAG: cobalamin biosynthesis protein CobD [Deltaproteobacteria bacterium]|jgi:adenosylcobinamide-phosphate synthase|nr:MAG: cobalamin biosynthesis protein CobD [Deltaproteobacteria bacterium]
MTPTIFLGAYIIDIIVGDPCWFPHPVAIIGRWTRFVEGKIRAHTTRASEKKGGIILWFSVVIPTFFITCGIIKISFFIGALFGIIMTALLASLTLAARSLYEESRVVIVALTRGDMEAARKGLSMIVGRDTESLDEAEILRAVIETVSENLSDGIVAPMLYLTVGGVPLAMAYKAVNTLDSMVGYRNARYRDIG